MKHIASCSFGKDSIATILLAIENNEPLDGAVFSEVMFDLARNISGENPEHIKWIYTVAIPRLAELGCPVEVVRAERDYVSYFSKTIQKGKRKGQVIGFPIGGMCAIQRDCKVAPIHKWYKQFTEPVMQYVGIAADEPRRLERLKDNQISLLAKYGYTEEMAMAKCIEYGLVSPIYENSHRGGQKILDTHLGSGSSRIAAWHAGLDFWGCELDKEYFDKANERFEKEIHGVEVVGDTVITQQSLFDE